MKLSITVHISQKATGLGMGHAGALVHPDAAHERHVEHHPAVTRGEPRDVVTAAFDGQGKSVFAREIHGRYDVRDAKAAHNERRPTVYHGVPKGTRLVVCRLAG
jgi:hypothetical protein